MITGRIKILFTLILLVSSTFTFPQDIITEYEKKISITTGLFDYFPDKLNSGNFNIGAEINLKGRKSFAANFGYIRSYGSSGGWFQIPAIGNKGIKIQLEGRHYLDKHKILEPLILLFWPMIFQFNSQENSHTGYYIAASTFYQRTLTERDETVVDYISDTPYPNSVHYRVNNFTVERNIIGIHIKFGYKAIKKCGFVVDFSFGPGIQYIESQSYGKAGVNNDREFQFNPDFLANKLFDSGSGIFPGFIYTLKIGWSF
jgi:hypothetical protein